MSVEFPENQDIPEVETLELLEFGGEQDLVNAAIQHAQMALPEWTPRESNTEVVLIESLALILGVEALSLQSVGSQVVEQLLGLYGVVRHDGFLAEGQARFKVSDSAPLQVIPAGTRLRYTLEESEETIDFLTVEAVEILTAESLFGTAMIEAEESGVEGNGIPEGAELDLVDPLTFVDAVTVSRYTTGGEGEESDESFQARAAAVLSRLNSTLVIPDNFTDACLSDPRVGRALTLDLYNPDGDPRSPVPGHVTVAVMGSDSQPLDEEVINELQDSLSAQALASLQVHVIAPTVTAVNISCEVKRAVGYSEADVETAVQESVSVWLNPATWNWAPAVERNAIIGLLVQVPGVASVVDVNPTVPLPGDAPLARMGTVTVVFV